LLLLLLGLLLQQTTSQIMETTNAGEPVDNIRDSLTVGPNGPILIQDAWTLERLQIQNRERIPERTVHAQGAVAKGNFVVTNQMTDYTMAAFLNETGKSTPVLARFSTVIHSKDSPEFLRDPRGFALKFYTEQGNYDIVGLDFPVFFIRDGRRFPEMIRSLKPDPVTGVSAWWRTWDYFSQYPESTHMFTWLLDDAGIPANFRQMDGWGVHTYTWINQQGKAVWVRYTYLSNQGVSYLMDDEASQMQYNFATIDLYQNIQNGSFPSWTVYVQILDPYNTSVLNFDPLDTTKQWPTDVLPYQEIGVLTFNENPSNQFAENEMAAFAPSRMVPGIEASAERMLQWRLYAYPDTQRYRLGVNNQMLPVNAPRCPFMNNHQNGEMNFAPPEPAQHINYFPSLFSGQTLSPPYSHDPITVLQDAKVRVDIDDNDDFMQPSARYNSWDPARQQRFAMRIASSLSGQGFPTFLQNIWLEYWYKVSPQLYNAIKGYLQSLQDPSSVSQEEAQKIQIFRNHFFRSHGSSYEI